MAADHQKIEVRPRNWLTPMALLIMRDEPSHGYELMERLEVCGFEAMNPGTLYRTLRHMEKDGLCESEWEAPRGGRARRIYSVTNAGEEHLAAWAERTEKYQQVLVSFSRAYARG